MAEEIWVRGPDGATYTVSEAEYQSAINQGFTNLTPEEAAAAQDSEIRDIGQQEAVTQGLLQAPDDYSRVGAFAERVGSNLTFGQAFDSAGARARGLRYQEEHPVGAFGADVAGGLPLAVAGTAAATATGGALGLGALGTAALDFGVGALVGGAQTEGEQTRLAGDEFSWTDAAVAGLAGEAIGRGAAWGVSRAVGGARNLLAKGERELVAQDVERSLSKGGWVNDYRVAQHADQYHTELAELAARDLDTLEENFAEVSRQDRKRARITRVVADQPEVQGAIRVEAAEGLRGLRDALQDELADAGGHAGGHAGGPAKTLLRQLDERIGALEEGRTGKRLWRTLDENRQALQDYQRDLHQAYENNPGSAWLSREGLAAIDAAEKATREALLREDAWGAAAAQMQREYNVPFNEKYFPTEKTIRGKLMFSPHRDARGFPVWRGEPAHVKKFLTRAADDVDGHRLGEQFREYLDGVEAIARAGEKDTPQAARNTLEAVRRLRKAVANAAYITEAAGRTKNRQGLLATGVEVAGAATAAAAAGPGAGALGYVALRGARVGDFLHRAGARLGWGAGKALSMADLLAKDALPAVERRDSALVDDLFDAGGPRPPSEPPPTPAGPGGGGGGGLTPSMRADAARGSWRPTPTPESGVSVRAEAPTGADDLAPEPEASLEALGRPSREERAATPTVPVQGREVGRGQQERLELDGLRDAAGPSRREAARLQALTEGEFRDVVGQLRASGDEEALELASHLESNADELVEVGLVSNRPAPSLDEVDEFYRRRASSAAPSVPATAEAHAATQAFEGMGLQVRLGGERLGETLDTVFGAGKAPTPEQWQRIIPLKTLEQIGPVDKARIDVLGDSFIWSAEGKESVTGPYRDWDGSENVGGTPAEAWRISRTFSRDDAGRLEVHHDHFFVRPDLQGGGAGAKVLRDMMDVYRKIGVDVVTVDSIEVGKYFWPSIGFNCSKADVERAVTKYVAWLERTGKLAENPAAANEARAIRSLPALAQTEFGKDFLLEVSGPWNHDLRLELKDENPLYHLMRGRLDIAAAGLAALGGALEGSGEDGGESGGAAAAAVGGLGLFSRRASLFKQTRTRLVADVAKRLFSATAEPAARVVARLAYDRATLKARQEEFQAWQANPQELVDRVAEGFRDVPPEHSGAVAGGVFKTATFLKQRLPTVTKLNAVSLRQIPVSAEAMAKYARYEQAALRPREALQEAAAGGHISAELMETLGELYPDLLAELRVGAILQVKENGPPTTVQSKLSYARLFDGRGELADPSMSQTVANMTAYAYEQSVPVKPGGGPTSSGNVSHVAAASAAPRMGLAG